MYKSEIAGRKLFVLLLSGANIAFVLYLLVIARANVIQLDDFCFLARVRSEGFWQSLYWWYANWQGRIFPQLATNLFVLVFNSIGSLLPYTLLLMTTFAIALSRLINRYLVLEGFSGGWRYGLAINLAILLFNAILLFHPDTSTFFWLNVSTMYFGGMAMLLLGISFLLHNSSRFGNLVGIAICFSYAGCSAEHVGLLTVAGTLIWLLALHFNYVGKPGTNTKTLKHKVLIAFVCALVFFLTMYFAPGNQVRRSYFPPASFKNAFQYFPTGISSLLFNVLAQRAAYLFIAFLPFLYIGAEARRSGNVAIEPNTAFRIAVVLAIGLIAIAALTIFLFAYATGGQGPARALVHLSTLCCLSFAILGYVLGTSITIHGLQISRMLALGVVGCLLLIAYNRWRVNLSPTLEYANSARTRLEQLRSMSLTTGRKVVVVERLRQDWRNALVDGEMAAGKHDTSRIWINGCLKEALNLPFEIEVKMDSTGKSE